MGGAGCRPVGVIQFRQRIFLTANEGVSHLCLDQLAQVRHATFKVLADLLYLLSGNRQRGFTRK